MTLEICAGSIESVSAAMIGGADRVELCSALADGGVTPSIGLIRQAVKEGVKVNVLMRPRGGDFLYTEDEIQIMEQDIKSAVEAGANGIVIGALTKEGDIDKVCCKRLIEVAHYQLSFLHSPFSILHSPFDITFHRAFDMVRDADKALEDVIALGCNRILTSGLQASAEKGIPMLRHLVEKAAGRIIIMPGAGVNPENAAKILKETGAQEIHASARSSRRSMMEYRNPNVTMGNPDVDEYARKETSVDTVKQIKQNIN